MYSTENEPRSVIAEIFVRTLKNEIHKHMTTTGTIYIMIKHVIISETYVYY